MPACPPGLCASRILTLAPSSSYSITSDNDKMVEVGSRTLVKTNWYISPAGGGGASGGKGESGGVGGESGGWGRHGGDGSGLAGVGGAAGGLGGGYAGGGWMVKNRP